MTPLESGKAGHYAPWLAQAHRRVRAMLARLHPWLAEFIIFGFKQGWACLFGGLMLGMLIVSKLIWQPDWPIARYDALLVAAFLVQAAMLALKLETWDEAKVIFLFHLVGTAMEVFKTAMGSWSYPEPSLIRIGDVPLFTGFMYACVGSYIARVIRIFDMRFVAYPPFWSTVVLAVAIYVNFFSHHYTWDVRYALFAATFLVFWRTRIYFTVDVTARWMPLLLAAFLTSVFLWIAENIGTMTGTWLYPNQRGAGWRPVTLHKMGAWYLLLVISFVLVTLVHRPDRPDGP
ncbi:MAG: DUF817 domain-containing protein, partial [Beijerinckiaceae bacterium]|nr:DUF817 domain-containing protein [Beijerinckiaceae bacterium]